MNHSPNRPFYVFIQVVGCGKRRDDRVAESLEQHHAPLFALREDWDVRLCASFPASKYTGSPVFISVAAGPRLLGDKGSDTQPQPLQFYLDFLRYN